MAFEFKLPDVGEGIAEGEIVKWLVKEGDRVEEDQPLVEVMTDKATVEIPSPRAGVIAKLMAREGEVVPVGAVLVVFAEDKAEAEEVPAAAQAQAQAPAPAREADGRPAPAPTATVVPSKPPEGRVRVLATPATRRLARELGVDITQVSGTGPGGRVTADDVKRFAESLEAGIGIAPTPTPTGAGAGVEAPEAEEAEAEAPSVLPTPIPAGELEERVPLRGLRRVIARHMRQAKDHAAHFTYVDEVDMHELVALRAQARPLAEERGVKLTYLPFIVKATVAALKEYPYLNAVLDEEKGEIVLKRYYNIGIATATDQGLMVPVVKGADRRSVLEIAQEVERLATAARQGKIALEDLQGSTFTITSLGALGGLFATPIVNYPELAILGVHEIKKRPVVVEDRIKIREVMLLSLSFDHRIIDGHVGAAFAKEVKALLEDPRRLWLTAL